MRIAPYSAVTALSAFLILTVVAGPARSAWDEQQDYRRLKRAVFLSLGTLAADKKAAEQAFILIGKLRSPEIARIGAKLIENDFDTLRASRLRALEMARDTPDPDRQRKLDRPWIQQGLPPFKVVIPEEFSFGMVQGPRGRIQPEFTYLEDNKLLQEIAILKSGIADLKPLQSVMFRNLQRELSSGIRANGHIVREDKELTPDLKHNVLRRVVFLQLGVFGSDPMLFDNALSSLAEDMPWIKDERKVIGSEIPRFCTIKRTWLNDVVIPRLLAANDSERVEVEIPREVWVEDTARAYKAIEYFMKRDIPLLEYQVEMLSNPGAMKGLDALSPERQEVIYLAAVTILLNYDASAKQIEARK